MSTHIISRIWFVVAGTLVLGGGGVGAWAQPEITAAELRAHVEFLASPELEGRKLGTKGAEKTEAYIAAAMQACGLKPLGDQGGYFQEFDVERGGKGRNVIGMIEGGDASLREQVVVLGAHHDHVGVVSEPGEAGKETLFPGADDNASGVAGLLELAQYFSHHKASLKRSIVLVAFGGEEAGLLGSRHYVDHPAIPLTRTVAMVNLDMIGRLEGNALKIPGTDSSPDLAELVRRSDTGAGFTLEFVEVQQGFRLLSDHDSFSKREIPSLDIFTGIHDDMHKPSDTADKLNFEGMARVVEFARSVTEGLNRNPVAPRFVPTERTGSVSRNKGPARKARAGRGGSKPEPKAKR